ncbi:prolipoprotein diacylglyceryl transferase [Magnetococcales bacterium HHB-1]
MLVYPEIDPVIIQLGPLAVRWYGLMYSLAFILGWPLLQYRVRKQNLGLSPDTLADLMVWVILGVLLGGRFGYILFYHSQHYLANPLAIFRIWEGGMSFHGGLVGVIIACFLFAWRRKINGWDLADLLAVVTPVGLFLGRIGNFINGELWGRVTDLPWGMVFPHVGPEPRHPSQLYEAFLEGIVLFVLLWFLGRKPRKKGYFAGVFLVGYGTCRFLVEFVREPDRHLGLLAGLTMGQWLCLPMLAVGFWLILKKEAAKQ